VFKKINMLKIKILKMLCMCVCRYTHTRVNGVYNMYKVKELRRSLIISVRLKQLVDNNEVLRKEFYDNVILKEWL
jgi:hypothetical protein